MGLESGDIAAIEPISPRQMRNILTAKEHPSSNEALAQVAVAATVCHGVWIKQIRDGLIAFLAYEGMDPEDIATALERIGRHVISVRARPSDLDRMVLSRSSLAGSRTLESIPPGRLERATKAIAEDEAEHALRRRESNARRVVTERARRERERQASEAEQADHKLEMNRRHRASESIRRGRLREGRAARVRNPPLPWHETGTGADMVS